MLRIPPATPPFAAAAARFIVRRECIGPRLGRMAEGALLAAVTAGIAAIALLTWISLDLGHLMDAPR